MSADLYDGLTDEEQAQLDAAFPDALCPFEASGGWVVVQDRRQPERTKGGILLAAETGDYAREVESIGRVVSVGPAAGFDEIGQQRPGWPWFEPGDFVKLPRWSSNRQVAPGEVVYRHVRPSEVLSVLTDLGPLLR